jgi:large subunit ribosomal protein L23
MLNEQGKYVFEVIDDANKIQVKQAVEEVFKVKVRNVNMMRVPGKMRRMGRTSGMTRSWKKAVVSLEPGQRIELFQGV